MKENLVRRREPIRDSRAPKITSLPTDNLDPHHQGIFEIIFYVFSCVEVRFHNRLIVSKYIA